MFKIKVAEQCVNKINGMDEWLSAMLIAWIEHNLSRCANPRYFGKSLFRKDNRFWQYRLGEYRLLAIIYDDSKLIVLTDLNYQDSL